MTLKTINNIQITGQYEFYDNINSRNYNKIQFNCNYNQYKVQDNTNIKITKLYKLNGVKKYANYNAIQNINKQKQLYKLHANTSFMSISIIKITGQWQVTV